MLPVPMRALLCLPLFLTLAGGAAPSGPAAISEQESVAKDPLTDLRELAETLSRADQPDPPEVLAAEFLFHDLRLLWTGQEGRRREIAAVVADWIGVVESRQASGAGGELELRTARRAIAWLGPRLGAGVADALAREVATRSTDSSAERRAGACRILAASDEGVARMALFAASRDPERLVRDVALASLAGRDDQAVHTLLIEILTEAEAGKIEIRKGLVEEHFLAAHIGRSDAAFARVLVYVRRRLIAEDWRRASRAIAIGRCLENEVLLGPLVEALPVWMEYEEAGLPAKRIQGDLLTELRRRTGRKLGLHPERWRLLLEAVRSGQLTIDPGAADGSRPYSEASFFGLRPWTDRVVFVIDRSGSMDQPYERPPGGDFTGAARSRHAVAIAQLISFLEALGPNTRFNVVLFSDEATSWRRKLVPATKDNLKSVAGWAVANGTGGSTRLQAGIHKAAALGRDGSLDLADLEADTVIVLCDGETDEGPDWVETFLHGVNDEARLRFHSVQIGGSGDGSLHALCDGSGGDYSHVGD